MSGLFGSVNIKGNRLTEFAAQTSTVGIPIPFGFGKFPVEGNVIFAPMPPKEHVKKKKQGKGGVKTTEYSYSLSYAIAFCEGPIYGFLTIKRNGKIVWTQDPNASVDDKLYAFKWKQKATFYYGTETQLPDSTIQAYKGVGRVSAFRGIAYIVVEDDDVTDNGGAVPTYEAVVIASPPEIYLTSHPYQILYEDVNAFSFEAETGELRTLMRLTEQVEANALSFYPVDGSLREPVVRTDLPSEVNAISFAPQSGALYAPIVQTTLPPEATGLLFAPVTGSMKVGVVATTLPAESNQLSFAPLSGSLA